MHEEENQDPVGTWALEQHGTRINKDPLVESYWGRVSSVHWPFVKVFLVNWTDVRCVLTVSHNEITLKLQSLQWQNGAKIASLHDSFKNWIDWSTQDGVLALNLANGPVPNSGKSGQYCRSHKLFSCAQLISDYGSTPFIETLSLVAFNFNRIWQDVTGVSLSCSAPSIQELVSRQCFETTRCSFAREFLVSNLDFLQVASRCVFYCSVTFRDDDDDDDDDDNEPFWKMCKAIHMAIWCYMMLYAVLKMNEHDTWIHILNLRAFSFTCNSRATW